LERFSPCFALCQWGKPSFFVACHSAETVLYYRRRLPHWVPDGAVVFVTWRLADSGPPVRPAILTAENTGRTSRHHDQALDDARTGPQWLRQPGVAQIVENALRYGETARRFYSLYAWVIMPNHVHPVFQPKAALPSTMRWLKGRTGRDVNRVLGRTGLPFWQDESYDHWSSARFRADDATRSSAPRDS
jgi:putative transposase